MAKLINQYGFTLSNMRNFAKAAGLILLPMVLIIMQRETGSALVYLAFFLMFYREGMPGCILITAVAAVAYFVIGIRFGEVELPRHPHLGRRVCSAHHDMDIHHGHGTRLRLENQVRTSVPPCRQCRPDHCAARVRISCTLRRVVGTVSPLRVHGRLFGLAIVGPARQHLPVHSHFHHRQCRPALYRRLCSTMCSKNTSACAYKCCSA